MENGIPRAHRRAHIMNMAPTAVASSNTTAPFQKPLKGEPLFSHTK